MGEVGTGTAGSRFLKTDFPITEGLTAGTTKLREEASLIPEEADLTPEKDRVGL